MQIWSEDEATQFFSWNLPSENNEEGHTSSFARAISSNIAADGSIHVCVGSSYGAIYVFSFTAEMIFHHTSRLQQHSSPITAVGSAHQSRKGKWTDDLTCEFVACDEAGYIYVWKATDSMTYILTCTIDLGGVPCISVAVRQGFIICGKLDGTVRIYGVVRQRYNRWIRSLAFLFKGPLKLICWLTRPFQRYMYMFYGQEQKHSRNALTRTQISRLRWGPSGTKLTSKQ